jgi:predicted dehydrogenase
MTGVGIVGAGIIFDEHARALRALSGRARLVGVAELDPARREAAMAKHEVPRGYRDHTELLADDDVDLVIVGTPPCLHEQVVIDALQAGRHVVCEKPLAHTLESADRIIEVAERHPGRLSTVFQFRHTPEVERTIWLRDSGALGRLLFGRFTRYARFNDPWRVKAGKPKPPRRDWWGRWGVAGGGQVMTQLIHELDMACHVFGPVAEVTAVVDTLKERIESEDTSAAIVRFASGATVTCFGTMCAHKAVKAFDVIGEQATAHSPWVLECMNPDLRSELRRAVVAACPDPPEDSTAHTRYLASVLDAVDAGAPLPIGGREGRAALELAVAIYASALTGTTVPAPLDASSPFYGGITPDDYAARGAALEAGVA